MNIGAYLLPITIIMNVALIAEARNSGVIRRKKMNELIIVKQLPIIEENLMALKAEIEEKADRAMNLVCTEDTVKDIKAVRSDLTKEFAELETQRKFVKEQVMKPYEAFESIYKECVSNIYKKADGDLKAKIDEVEESLKAEKREAVVGYFYEYAETNGIDFATFEEANIKVGLSDSMKSLKDKAKASIDKIVEDIALIKTQEYADEIMVEYESCLNASRAITAVVFRHKALDSMVVKTKAQAEAEQAQQEAEKKVEQVLSAPIAKPIEEKQYKSTFEVTGTLDELKSIKAFMENNSIVYLTK
jgi:hypothetical protein